MPSNLSLANIILHTLHSRQPLASGMSRAIFPISDNIVAKVGFKNNTDEISFLKFLSQTVPSIVAPRALGQIVLGSTPCLFMTRLPGETLLDIWPNLSVEDKRAVQKALTDMLSDLRKIELPAGSPMGSLSEQHVCRDVRMFERVTPAPIFTEHEFNAFLMTSPGSCAAPGYRRWISSMMSSNHRIVLTHADLHPKNIMVARSASGKLTVGIIDWEFAGFYPEYWEQLKALNLRSIDDTSDWWDHLPPCITGYDYEIVVDRLLERTVIR